MQASENNLIPIQNPIHEIRGHKVMLDSDLAQRLAEMEQYFIQDAKENNTEIDKINEALNLLMDRTKPANIGFTAELK